MRNENLDGFCRSYIFGHIKESAHESIAHAYDSYEVSFQGAACNFLKSVSRTVIIASIHIDHNTNEICSTDAQKI